MYNYALTYSQLMNQARAQGIDKQGLIRLRTSLQLGETLMDGLYRKTATPFLCHGIRTASIVMRESDSIDIVVAAMLHAVYFLHYFEGSSRRGPRASDKVDLRAQIGEHAEKLIELYPDFPWGSEDITKQHIEKVNGYSATSKALLLMLLANELEDHLDAAELYSGKPYHCPRLCPQLAQRLGHHNLAVDMNEAFDFCDNTRVPAWLETGKSGSYQANRSWLSNPVEKVGSMFRRSNLLR